MTTGSAGTQLAYRLSGTAQATIGLAIESTSESIQLEMKGADVGPGQVLTVTADIGSGHLVFDSSDSDGGAYDLDVRRLSSAGSDWFVHPDIAVSAGDTHYADYGGWMADGTLTLQVDSASDGSIDETIPLENELTRVCLPLVARGY